MTSDGKEEVKKPYHSPVIEVYGDIRTITESAGMNSLTSDTGGKGSNVKTA